MIVLGCAPLAGCSGVASRGIIGETPLRLETEQWNGSWGLGGIGRLVTRVKDADAGLLEFAALELKKDEIAVHRGEVHVRKASGWLWASGREQGNDEFWIARISEPDTELIAWRSNPEAVRRLVKTDTFAGQIARNAEGAETGDVTVNSPSDADPAKIREGRWGEVFDWREPTLVLQRLDD